MGPQYDNGQAGHNTNSISFTVGNNPQRVLVLFVGSSWNNCSGNQGADLNGVPFTQLNTDPSGQHRFTTFVFFNPPVGANTINMSSDHGQVQYCVASFYNVDQSGVDGHNSTQDDSNGNNHLDDSIVTGKANCLVWGAGTQNGAGVSSTTGMGTNSFSDTNGVFSSFLRAGSGGVTASAGTTVTQRISSGSLGAFQLSQISLAPYIAPPVGGAALLALI